VQIKVSNDQINRRGSVPGDEGVWIQKPINLLNLSCFTQKIIDGIYSVVNERADPLNDQEQSWFWTDEWQAGERKVDEYIQMGKIEEFNSMDDFLKTLRD
jgi:hypothetical protein